MEENQNANSIADYKFANIAPVHFPKYVGSYFIGVYHIMLENKPNFIHRFFMRVLLGFKWKDNADK